MCCTRQEAAKECLKKGVIKLLLTVASCAARRTSPTGTGSRRTHIAPSTFLDAQPPHGPSTATRSGLDALVAARAAYGHYGAGKRWWACAALAACHARPVLQHRGRPDGAASVCACRFHVHVWRCRPAPLLRAARWHLYGPGADQPTASNRCCPLRPVRTHAPAAPIEPWHGAAQGAYGRMRWCLGRILAYVGASLGRVSAGGGEGSGETCPTGRGAAMLAASPYLPAVHCGTHRRPVTMTGRSHRDDPLSVLAPCAYLSPARAGA